MYVDVDVDVVDADVVDVDADACPALSPCSRFIAEHLNNDEDDGSPSLRLLSRTRWRTSGCVLLAKSTWMRRTSLF